MPLAGAIDDTHAAPSDFFEQLKIAERSHRPAVCPSAVEDAAHAFREQLLVRPSVLHELGEGVFSIKRDVLVLRTRGLYVESLLAAWERPHTP